MTPAPQRYVHATAVVIGERGILIQGPSGSGKSTLALRLVAEARRRGRFARLVGDDRVALADNDGVLVVRPHPAIAGRIERRGLPMSIVMHEPACVLRLVVQFVPEPLPRLPDATSSTIRLLERIDVPVLRLEPRNTDLACLFVLEDLSVP